MVWANLVEKMAWFIVIFAMIVWAWKIFESGFIGTWKVLEIIRFCLENLNHGKQF